MKILFIISSLSSGGAERVLTNLANEMSPNHQVYIVTFSNEIPFYELNKCVIHIKIDMLKMSYSKIEMLMNNLKRMYRLKELMQDIQADINISFMTQTNILAILAAKLSKQNIIISERIAYDFFQSRILNFIRRWIYPYANILVTQTLADKRNYKFLKNVKVIYNPLLIDTISKERENIVLAVGRLEKQKGFENLIKVFSTIKDETWKLCIVGDGSEKENLQRIILELNIKNVELLGKRKDVFDLYSKASIFVLSSQKEGFPNVLLEAMGSGCACVSFDCKNGPREIIENDQNGILVEDQNFKYLIYQIQQLIAKKDLRVKLSREAMKVRDSYSIKKISSQWEKVMQDIEVEK